jgi:inositol transport system permease protein
MRKVLTGKKIGQIYSKIGIFIILIVIVIASSLASPHFLSTGNLTNILKQIAVVAILSLGATYVIILGHINVSYGSAIALIGSFSCQVISLGSVLLHPASIMGASIMLFYAMLFKQAPAAAPCWLRSDRSQCRRAWA